jgi:hypothetical protein
VGDLRTIDANPERVDISAREVLAISSFAEICP